MITAADGWALAVARGGAGSRTVLRTRDGGVLWSNVAPPGIALDSSGAAGFVDAQHAVVAQPLLKWKAILGTDITSAIQVATTADGGDHWTVTRTAPPTTLPGALRLDFVSSRDGWMSESLDEGMFHYAGGVARTTDGGATWHTVSSQPLFGMTFRPNGDGWGVTGSVPVYDGEQTLLHSADGGKTWHAQALPVPPDHHMDSIVAPPRFFGNDAVMAAFVSPNRGDTGIAAELFVSHDGGDTWTIGGTIGSGLDFMRASFISAATGWVMRTSPGNRGCTLRETTDAGASWSDRSCPGVGAQLQFLDAKTGFALSDPNEANPYRLWRTTDGGKTWQEIAYAVRASAAAAGG